MGAPRILAPTTISGGIPTAGAGTLNTVALWTPDGFTLGNSLLTQSGSVITNATGAIRANGTTQSTPAFMRYDATTSGIYFPATNEIGFTISSQHAMFISSGRFVGIGTTTPGYRLHVKDATNRNMIMTSGTTGMKITSLTDAGAEADIGVQGNTVQFLTGGTERARIDSTGYVGIGTASPLAQFTLGGVANSTTKMGFQAASTEVGSITMNSATGEQRITSGFAAWGGFQTFYTNGSERARIDSAGNFGIGTASPNAILSVYNAGTPTISLWNSSNYSRLATNTNDLYIDAGLGGAAGAVIFRRGSGTVDSARIDSSGRLGIGQTPTTYILETATDASIYGVRVGRGAGAVSSNTAVGASALNANTTGSQNTAVGNFAANAATTGANNTSIGFQANALLQGGSRNTAVGESAGYAILTGTDNTAVGRYAAVYNTGSSNVAIGSSALNGTFGSSTGGNNVAVGASSLLSLTTGVGNCSVGKFALANITTGNQNCALGPSAMYSQTTGNDCIGIGYQAGFSNVTSSNNISIGANASLYQTGAQNVVIGTNAMLGILASSSGANNTAIGGGALYTLTTGSNNTAVGLDAGNNITTGSSNICLGRAAATAAATDSNQLVVGSAAQYVATNGGATTYYATAGASLGYIQVRLNGANVKIQVFAP